MSSASKFDFDEVVVIAATGTEVDDHEGIVTGMVQKDDGSWYYAVDVKGHLGWCFEEYEL